MKRHQTPPKTIWTTHWELKESDGVRTRDKYTFNWRRLPKTAPEYLIELPVVEASPMVTWVTVKSPEGFGPPHLIRLVHFLRDIGGFFWKTREDAVSDLARVGIRDTGRSLDRPKAALHTQNYDHTKIMDSDELEPACAPKIRPGQIAREIDPEDLDPDIRFDNPRNLPLDALLNRNRCLFGEGDYEYL